MRVIQARNVHSALPYALQVLQEEGERSKSRAGDVLVMPTPVTTVYERPEERVLFYPQRDANPFFHLMESLWMMAGRRDVRFVTQYVSTMANFSDDGTTFHGAYGYRWRLHFDTDQIPWAIERLRANRDDRRVVIGIWDPTAEREASDRNGKDLPCNLAIHFQARGESLDMTVFNRSNDIVWGCYGANAVHFSFLHEFIARSVGLSTGRYYQVSDNWHGYLNTLEKVSGLTETFNPYVTGDVEPFPIISTETDTWLQDLDMYMEEGPIIGLRDPFFRRVVTPVHHAHAAYRQKDDPERHEKALEIIEQCAASDWRRACREWLQRRQAAHIRAQDDGVNHEES